MGDKEATRSSDEEAVRRTSMGDKEATKRNNLSQIKPRAHHKAGRGRAARKRRRRRGGA
jgi:hypothetical protein